MKVKSTRVNQRDPSVTLTVQRVEIKKTEEFNYRGSTSGECGSRLEHVEKSQLECSITRLRA